MIIHSRTFRSYFVSVTRVHGSAVYKSFVPALLSTMILLATVKIMDWDIKNNDTFRVMKDPYVISVLVLFFTFLITFRANFAYGRYWEGATSVNQMLSKWLDVGTNMAAYHMQSPQYNSIKPPALGNLENTQDVARERERRSDVMTASQRLTRLNHVIQSSAKNGTGIMNFLKQKRGRISRFASNVIHERGSNVVSSPPRNGGKQDTESTAGGTAVGDTQKNPQIAESSHRLRSSRLNGGVDTRGPSLFLQETAHLISLLSAVAMATLRNDMDDVELSLAKFTPGAPWPALDPDDLPIDIRRKYGPTNFGVTSVYYIFGFDRTVDKHSLYNAARPFGVIGGVSDEEIRCLQEARGPYAKFSLCTMWLQEFLARENMTGGLGGVGSPMTSRLYQFISDGTLGYNQSRKISYVDFPFPSAQIAALFIFVVIFMFPQLYISFVNNLSFACLLNFTTVACFAGLHEVARELEDPFHNIPNDLPLTTFQAQFNEALCVMFAGFHPDAWWEPPPAISQPSDSVIKHNDSVLSDLTTPRSSVLVAEEKTTDV